jgi:hypothetical protein
VAIIGNQCIIKSMKNGSMDLPLHGGQAPAWLFGRMKKLAREITLAIILEYGSDEILKRLSDPIWFQSFGCVLGFDWHSSGVTTTVTGALKEGLKEEEKNIGIFFAGGKGRRGLETPSDIKKAGEKGYISEKNVNSLIRTSKLVAKVDAHALQDGYSIYHHFMAFDKKGAWIIVQQGMKTEKRYARRYHWSSDNLKSFTSDPHKGIMSERTEHPLNLVDREIETTREKMTEISKEESGMLAKELKKIVLPAHHPLYPSDFNGDYLRKILRKIKETSPGNFENLLLVPGVGEKTLRALALVANVIFGSELSFRDPALFSFAHGGKDGYPYPVDRKTYDRSIDILKYAVDRAKLGDIEKINALKRLKKFTDQ